MTHGHSLKSNRPEDDVDPPVEEFAFPFFVVEVGVFLPEGLDGDVFERNVHEDKLLQGGLAAHFGEPFVVELSADIVGMAVDADLVQFNIGNGVEQLQQLLCLFFVHIVASTPKEDAFLDQTGGWSRRRCFLGRGSHTKEDEADDQTKPHVDKDTRKSVLFAGVGVKLM
jgi:hypothetical protein